MIAIAGRLAALLAAGGLIAAGAPQQPSATLATSPQRALINQYCVTCHNDRLRTAGLSLDKADIANVGVDAFEDRKLAPWLCWQHHARLRHQGQQPYRLEGNRFTAGIRACHHDDIGFVIQINVNRHDALLI